MKYSKSLHLIIFFISMALLESAVVVYLRELYYPLGFTFPLSPMKEVVIITELAREFATIVMLWTIAFVAGRNFSSRFAWFIIGFGIWDIFYYVFLFVFIQWPATLVDWDILFLIPLPWYGPVIAPCLISVVMILFGIVIIYFDKKGIDIKWKSIPIITLLLGCLICLYTFMIPFWNSIKFVEGKSFSDQIMLQSQVYIPIDYNYGLFGLGIGLIGMGICLFYKLNSVERVHRCEL
jgi:hypothetical protein